MAETRRTAGNGAMLLVMLTSRFPARVPVIVLLAIAAGALTIAACGAFGRAGASTGGPLRTGAVAGAASSSARSHFVVLMMENREYNQVIGVPQSAPYINTLARHYTLATNYYAITHPSLPNYIALVAGDPLGINSDCTACVAQGPNVADQLQSAGLGWRAYMQDIPTPCYVLPGAADTPGGGGYAKKHDPFAYFPQIATAPARCANIVPLTQLTTDISHHALPPFVWITPNICNDGHDCSTQTADNYLRGFVPSVLGALGPHGVLALVWDEGTTGSGCCRLATGGHVVLVLAGHDVRHGGRVTAATDHYSLLRLIEDSFGLRHLRGAGCGCTHSLASAFRNGRSPHLKGH